ncbi:MAG: DpnI domain-containing protein, partial [Halobacteria archaeon]
MYLDLPADAARGYKSLSQRARVMTQAWGRENLYCPACPSKGLEAAPEGMEVIDFSCPRCESPYQLKSKSGPFG